MLVVKRHSHVYTHSSDLLADWCVAGQDIGTLEHGLVARGMGLDLQDITPFAESSSVLLVLSAALCQAIKTCPHGGNEKILWIKYTCGILQTCVITAVSSTVYSSCNYLLCFTKHQRTAILKNNLEHQVKRWKVSMNMMKGSILSVQWQPQYMGYCTM